MKKKQSASSGRKQEKKSEKKSEKKPSLESILSTAERAYTDATRNYLILGESLVMAITYYGSDGKRAFRTRFPLTDNALRNLELVGRGKLLPHFAMCSDKFVSGIVEMPDSIRNQHRLVGASQNGMIRVKVKGKITDIPLSDFRSNKITDAVLSILSEGDEDLSDSKLREKFLKIDHEIRSKFIVRKKPLYEYRVVDGKKVVRFLKAHTYDAETLASILEKLKEKDS